MFEWVLNTPLKTFRFISFLINNSSSNSRSYLCISSSMYIAVLYVLSRKAFIWDLFKTSILSKPLRSSRPEVFCKKGGLRNFTKFTGKHLCQSLSFNKVADTNLTFLFWQFNHTLGLIKREQKRLWYRCFPVNFVKFLRRPFLTGTSGGCF